MNRDILAEIMVLFAINWIASKRYRVSWNWNLPITQQKIRDRLAEKIIWLAVYRIGSKRFRKAYEEAKGEE